MLRLTAPDDSVVGENDDLDSLVRDAGLEAITLPQDGTYRVRIARYGATAGQYELVLTPGFARLALHESFADTAAPWQVPSGAEAAPAQGWLKVRTAAAGSTVFAVPPGTTTYDEMYFQATARLFGAPAYAEFGLVFYAQGPDLSRAYQFKINTSNQWRVVVQNDTGQFALRTWSAHTALLPTDDEWTLAVMARPGVYSFYANGQLLGTVSDERLAGPGAIGLLVGSSADQVEPVTVQFDEVILTERLGTTYRGLPLALAAWDSADPGAIANELSASGQVTLASARDLFLLEKTLGIDDQGTVFELIGSEQAIYTDFVLGAELTLVTAGNEPGCGLIYRWQSEQNLDLAYIDASGGFGVVQARDGLLVTNVYDDNVTVREDSNKLLVIAQGERVALYVNGALATEETVRPGEGRAGIALLNYEDVRTDCYWSNIWVWPLVRG